MAIMIPEFKPERPDSKKLRRVMERGSILMSALVVVILLAQHEQSLPKMDSAAMTVSSANYAVIAD